MLYSIQSHFEGSLLGRELAKETAKRYNHFRISAQNPDITLDAINRMLDEADSVGVGHLLTMRNEGILRQIFNRHIEWDNEPDGRVPLDEYVAGFRMAYDICKDNNNILYGPCISNTDYDSIDWLGKFMERVSDLPDFIVSYHTYRPNPGYIPDIPHRGKFPFYRGFNSREGEMKWLKVKAAGHQLFCTENGTNDDYEQRQADCMNYEWKFSEENGILGHTYYQIGDDPNHAEHFGARRLDGTWKPVADTPLYMSRL